MKRSTLFVYLSGFVAPVNVNICIVCTSHARFLLGHTKRKEVASQQPHTQPSVLVCLMFCGFVSLKMTFRNIQSFVSRQLPKSFAVVEWRDDGSLLGIWNQSGKNIFFRRVDLNQAFSTVSTKLMFPYLDWNSKLDLSRLVIGCLRFIFMHWAVRVLWFLATFCVFKCEGTNQMNNSSLPPHVKSSVQLAVLCAKLVCKQAVFRMWIGFRRGTSCGPSSHVSVEHVKCSTRE